MSILGQNIRVTVTPNGGLTTGRPITLRDTRSDFNAVNKMLDVDLTNKANNTLLVFNTSIEKYELKPFDEELIDTIDCGTF
jgi:hypothetical protein